MNQLKYEDRLVCRRTLRDAYMWYIGSELTNDPEKIEDALRKLAQSISKVASTYGMEL